jgi:hypothetical protein
MEALRVQDAQEAAQTFSEGGGEGSAGMMPDVATLGPANTPADVADASTTAAPAPSLSASDQSTLSTLSSAQVQYRAALRGGFDLLRSALLSCPDAEVQATKHLWSPMVNMAAWDRLAGANRLNCTQTQTALPFPHESNNEAVATATASASAAAGSSSPTPAAVASSSSSTDSSFPPLAAVLQSLFLPLGLPLASARALLLLHSKMNHACPARASTAVAGSSNARVENERESSDIAWSALSERRAHARAVETQSIQQRRLELEAAAKTSATGANASNGNRKKKIQKIRKEAAAQRALETKRAEQRWKDEEDTLAALLVQPQPQQQGGSPTAAAAASVDTQSAPAAATGPSFHPSSATIVVRASRAIQAGEEVLISYLPPSVAKADTRTRREYLQNNYLFECQCAVCSAEDSLVPAAAPASSATSKAQA